MELKLNKRQIAVINSLLEFLIPSSEDKGMPSAAKIGFIDYVIGNDLVGLIAQGVVLLESLSMDVFNSSFSALTLKEKEVVLQKNTRIWNIYLNELSPHILRCYYTSPEVLKAIGIDPSPPYPYGSNVYNGDLTLLERVYARSKIYRDDAE